MQRLAVYCGSRSGHDSAFASAAEILGETLVRHGVGLVYGAAQIGLMGVIADTVLKLGGEVIGVMPRALLEKKRRSCIHSFHSSSWWTRCISAKHA